MNKLALVSTVALTMVGFVAVPAQAASSSMMSSSSMMASSSMAADAMGTTASMAFTDADKDKDGFVDLGEAQAAYPTLGQKAFDEADTNHDDKLDATEYAGLGGQAATVDTGNNNSGGSSKGSSAQ